MAASESLFETSFVAEKPEEETSPIDTSDIFPNDPALDKSLITHRVLVSKREAGIIIGKNGDCISNIREETNVKAGVSKLIDGCVDRILTVSGTIENVAQALVLFAKAITDANFQAISLAESNGSPTPSVSYSFFPLKFLCPHPSVTDPAYGSTLSLRLLIPHAQMGTLIGKGGVRIKAIQEEFNIKMVASKDYLRNSSERVVEVQGTSNNLTSAVSMISKCLVNDYHGSGPIMFYNPSPRYANNGANNQRGGYNSRPQNSYNGHHDSNEKEVTREEAFPGDMVGALIGKRGFRIQDIRMSSGCVITIDPEDNENGDRVFKLVGSNSSIDKALSMLYNYLEKEKQRRAQNQEDGEEEHN